MPDDSTSEIVDPDQAMLDQMKAKGVDTMKALPVGIRLDFDPQVARQAAADLILAGYPSVRLDMVSTPAVIVTVHMVPTHDALRSLRARLTTFANARGADVVGIQAGGGIPPDKSQWKKDTSGNASTDQADQMVVDEMFAWDVDLKQIVSFNAGLGFPSEQAARVAGAALIAEGYPEVNVVQAEFGPVAEAVMYMTPEVKAIRKLRLNLTKFAASRGGTWLGFHVAAHLPHTGKEPAS
jgi:hypothetical protein